MSYMIIQGINNYDKWKRVSKLHNNNIILTEITNLFFKQESISFISIMLFIKFINFIMSKVIVTW